MPLTLKVETGKSIEDGRHTGVITRVVSRDVTFQKKGKEESATYVDVIIEAEHPEGRVELRWSAPANLNPKGKLGRTVANFKELASGTDVDVEAVLVGRKVAFMTMQNKDGYADIVDDSIKPVV